MMLEILKNGKKTYSLFAVLIVLLLLFPQVYRSPYYISIATLAILYSVFAASWDIVAGYTGQLVLGQALFIGIGGYSVGLLGRSIGVPAAMVFGVLGAVIFALIIGFPCLRLKGPFLGLTTLVMPLILERLAFTFREITGGEYGITIQVFLTRVQLYYISLALMFVCGFILIAISHSRIGKVFLAIKENELGVVAAGNNVAYYKLLAFVTSAIFTSLGGGLLAIYLRHIGPGSFSMATSLNVTIMGIVGGMGTIIGPVIGAFVLTFAGEYLRNFGQLNDLIYAVILIVAVVLFPAGFAGLTKKIEMSWMEGRFKKIGTSIKSRSTNKKIRQASSGE